MRTVPGRLVRGAVIVVAVALSGCSAIISQQTSGFADALGGAIRANKDLQTVKDGAPAYLLLMDAMVQQDPESPGLLLGAADLYGFYGGVFVDDPARAALFADKAMGFATQGFTSLGLPHWALYRKRGLMRVVCVRRFRPSSAFA